MSPSGLSPLERAGYLAHARSAAFLRRVERARATIGEMLDRCGLGGYVAFSLGKDSAVLLDLVGGLEPVVSARTLASGETRRLHENWEAVWSWWRAHLPDADLREILIDRVDSDEWQGADWQTQRKAGKGDMVNLLPASGQFSGVFLGLRDEESNARRIANKKGRIRRYSPERRDACAGMWVCCPLSDWKTQDIAAYTVAHDLPLLRAYETEGFDARTTARLTGDAVRQGGFGALRRRDPDGYNRLLSRFPELSWWNS